MLTDKPLSCGPRSLTGRLRPPFLHAHRRTHPGLLRARPPGHPGARPRGVQPLVPGPWRERRAAACRGGARAFRGLCARRPVGGQHAGLWLTIPHKTPAVALSQHLDRLGRRAGAVNALRREPDGSLRGALFDGLGLSKSLDHFGLAPEGRRVLVLGLGGAGTAVATSLAERSLGDLALWDRDPAHTQRITTR